MRLNRCWTALVVWLVMAAAAMAAPMKALIVDGQNAHNWKETTPILKKLLEETGLFTRGRGHFARQGTGHERLPAGLCRLQLVVLNYQGDDWPEATQKAFVDYVADGGGVVCYHFAAAAFPKWKEYNQIIAVGGWGDRNETAGPYLCWRDGKIVRGTDQPGKAGFHGPQQMFQVVVREPDHPITRGLPKKFMHGPDELYCRLRGPAENVTVLATAFAPKKKGGTNENEPMLMTITYGKGRVFANMLGHAGQQLEERGVHRHVPARRGMGRHGQGNPRGARRFPRPRPAQQSLAGGTRRCCCRVWFQDAAQRRGRLCHRIGLKQPPNERIGHGYASLSAVGCLPDYSVGRFGLLTAGRAAKPVGRLRWPRRAGQGKAHRAGLGRRGISLRGGPAATGQDSGLAPRLQMHRAVRHRSGHGHDRPEESAATFPGWKP